MVSNDLLSAVMGYKCYIMATKHIHFLHNNRVNDIVYERGSDLQYNINIYELAYKCKEWAFKNGYWLSVRLYEPNGFNIVIFSHIHSQLQKDLKEINDKSESEAIFKACEWILNHKGL